MINFQFNNYGINIQFIPIYGLSIGVLYYDPNLEPDTKVEDDEMYHQITLMFLVAGIHITYWRL